MTIAAYIMADVSRYTGAPASTVRAWFKGGSDREPVLRSGGRAKGGDFAISFHGMIDMLVAQQFRQFGVTLAETRRAYDVLRTKLGTEHPFCHRELYTDGRRIIAAAWEEAGAADLAEVVSGQGLIPQLRSCLARIEYCDAAQMAERWLIAQGVVIDPSVGYGRPVISRTAVSAHLIARQYEANDGNREVVADLFNVTVEDVENAVRFNGEFGRRDAA